LAKVRISGGGRCNVTTGIQEVKELSKCYPRGENYLKKALHQFSSSDTWKWFESRGVPLKTEKDGRVFPVSNSSQSIIDCLMAEAKKRGVEIKLGAQVKKLIPQTEGIDLFFKGGDKAVRYDRIIVATGGSPKLAGFDWLKDLGHIIESPVPSLFTLNMPDESITQLMGISVNNAIATIQGTKLKTEGPVLITHWGMSGPAILKLSAFGARILNELDYNCILQVNWINKKNLDEIFNLLVDHFAQHPQKPIEKCRAFDLPSRLWSYLLARAKVKSSLIYILLEKYSTSMASPEALISKPPGPPVLLQASCCHNVCTFYIINLIVLDVS